MLSSDEPKTPYEAWTTCHRHAEPFQAVRTLTPDLKVPPALWTTLAAASAVGFVVGLAYAESLNRATWAFACFCASIASYLVVVGLDLREHLRLEKFVTGRWIAWQVVPLGESILHSGIVSCLLGTLILSFWGPTLGPIPLLIATVGFFALGWCDELIYHRRRALHREDILHTVSHLAGGAVFATLLLSNMGTG